MSSAPDADTLHLTSADFDAYLPERATSNAFTRPRLELKQRMLGWAKGVVTRLAEIEVPVEVTGSDEHPSLRNGRRVDCQRVFFWRDAAARAEIERLIDHKRSLAATLGDPAPHQRHAYLGLRIDAQKVEVSVELHADAWVDLRNLRALLADPARILELTSALDALPDQFTVGLSDAPAERNPAAGTSSDTIRSLSARAEQEGKSLWIGWTIPRDVAVTHSEVLDDQLEDAIVALGPIQKLIAWAPDNDLIDLQSEVEAAKADRARVHEEAERDRAAWQAKRERVEQEERARGRERHERAKEVREAEPTPPPPAVGAEPKEPSERPRPRLRPETPRAVPRVLARRASVTEVDPTLPIEKGTRVQVLAGPFRGKVGVVQELDGRGAARVMLGLLATRVDVKELIAAAEGKDRPALATSHRKPIGARS
ncbi:MAG TPA: KOW motif-containing protein [Polyangiaceae bacterium]|jgi:transcription antitermination factor NusG